MTLSQFDNLSSFWATILSVNIVFSLTCFGMLFDRNTNGIWLEILREVGSIAFVVYNFDGSTMNALFSGKFINNIYSLFLVAYSVFHLTSLVFVLSRLVFLSSFFGVDQSPRKLPAKIKKKKCRTTKQNTKESKLI